MAKKIMSTKAVDFSAMIMPMMIPVGVIKVKTVKIQNSSQEVKPALTKEVPRAMAAVISWIMMPMANCTTDVISSSRPKAIPSKMAWKPNATIRMTAVTLVTV